MEWLVEKSRYLPLIGIFSMLVGSMAAFAVGAVKTIHVLQTAVTQYTEAEPTLYVLFEALDCFLVGTGLIVIAVGLYELFIGGLEVPDWMLVKSLDELKAKFVFVIIPVMAAKFIQKILKQDSNAIETLYYGTAIAIVTLALSAFVFVSIKEKEVDREHSGEEEERRAKDLIKNK
ncbi:MAG TPA: YqhA family protein [Pyrinomonadaceae bacterium]|jgi:uncharacterized membrane protein YqhA